MKTNDLAKAIKQIKEQVSIIDVASYFYSVVRHGSLWKLEEHNSCILYPKTNSFFRYSTGVGGDPIRFMTDIVGKDFNEAIEFLLTLTNDKGINLNLDNSVVKKELHPLDRNKKLRDQLTLHDNNKKVAAYLIKTRGIDPSIVFEFIKEGRIRQVNYCNVCCCAFMQIFYSQPDVDKSFISAVSVRSINKDNSFKGDLKYSSYEYGWFVEGDWDAYSDKTLIVFEGYIDMLSYCSLIKQNKNDYKKYDYLVLGSISKQKALKNILKRYSRFKKVISALDNDRAGIEATDKIEKIVKDAGRTFVIHRSKGKDWNDDLLAKQNKEVFKPKDNEKER